MSVQRTMETVKTNVLTLMAAIRVDAGQAINWLWIKGPVKVIIATIRIRIKPELQSLIFFYLQHSNVFRFSHLLLVT